MARKPQENPKAEMTPMIDVVFQLMIFFVVTIKQEDIFSKLNANRPAPNQASSSESNDTPIKIEIAPCSCPNRSYDAKNKVWFHKQGRKGHHTRFLFKGREVKLSGLRENLANLAKSDKDSPVLIHCHLGSLQCDLVDVLDACNQFGLRNLSIFSK